MIEIVYAFVYGLLVACGVALITTLFQIDVVDPVIAGLWAGVGFISGRDLK